MKKFLSIFGILSALFLLIVLAMFVLNLCPPSGPWPTPPWCAGNSFLHYSAHPEQEPEKQKEKIKQEKEKWRQVYKNEKHYKKENFQKGITFGAMKWDEYSKKFIDKSLREAEIFNVNTIVLIPDWFVVPGKTGTEIKPFYEAKTFPNKSSWITPTLRDDELKGIIRKAKAKNMRVVLKPHVDPIDFGEVPGSNRVELRPANWGEWFASYEKFILHYARLAQEENADLFVVGTELDSSIWGDKNSDKHWRDIIKKVREIYKGKITYSAACYAEHCNAPREVSFWDALDYIGFEPYFSLTSKNNPSVEEMKKVFDAKLDKYAKVLANKYKKPVILTEVNVYSYDGVNKNPIGAAPANARPDHQEQADYYEALFRSLAGKDYIQGLYLWGWYLDTTIPSAKKSQKNDFGDSFAQKPAGEIVRKWFYLIEE